MARPDRRAAKRLDTDDRNGPLRQEFFFQSLPSDIQMVVLQGVKFRLSKDSPPEDLCLLDLDDLLDEEADDLINRNNIKRTLKGWLAFAETGE